MKIATIGSNPQNFFNPIAKELKQNGHTVDLIAFNNSSLQDYKNIYDNTFFNVYNSFSLKNLLLSLLLFNKKIYWKIIFGSGGLKDKIKMLFLLKKIPILNEYDIINIHYVNVPLGLLDLVNKDCKVVLSFWGSDIYTPSNYLVKQQKKWLQKTDVVTLHHNEMENIFKNRFPEFKGTIVRCLFPLNQSLFQYFKDCKKEDSNKINIALGYNVNPSFRHIEIINELTTLSEEMKSKIRLVIYAVYGGEGNYLTEIIEAIQMGGFEYIVHENRVDLLGLAQRRVDTDVLIQLPDTDAFSASVSEILFAKNIVIAGSWLPYSLYKENGIEIQTVDAVSEIAGKIEYVINNLNELKEQNANNPQKVLNTLDYKGNLVKWVNIFTN